jgi:hypothetical protein
VLCDSIDGLIKGFNSPEVEFKKVPIPLKQETIFFNLQIETAPSELSPINKVKEHYFDSMLHIS